MLRAAQVINMTQGQSHLFTVVPDHSPHQLLLAVKLVLHLKEGQSEEKDNQFNNKANTS